MNEMDNDDSEYNLLGSSKGHLDFVDDEILDCIEVVL